MTVQFHDAKIVYYDERTFKLAFGCDITNQNIYSVPVTLLHLDAYVQLVSQEYSEEHIGGIDYALVCSSACQRYIRTTVHHQGVGYHLLRH